jgi:hypothetical protein
MLEEVRLLLPRSVVLHLTDGAVEQYLRENNYPTEDAA